MNDLHFPEDYNSVLQRSKNSPNKLLLLPSLLLIFTTSLLFSFGGQQQFLFSLQSLFVFPLKFIVLYIIIAAVVGHLKGLKKTTTPFQSAFSERGVLIILKGIVYLLPFIQILLCIPGVYLILN